jgi:hypothetical protein
LILQHARERFHPFNTARIVALGLERSRLWHGYPAELAASELAASELAESESVGLLFPSDSAQLLSEAPASERPQRLVILDGTWHHAKTMVRDIPLLNQMPKYRLAPIKEGAYRIRREPTATSLSTIEATVAALRICEPETLGLDALLAVFDKMIDDQLAHPNSLQAWRRKRPRRGPSRSIPAALAGDLDQLVVAYGEAAPNPTASRNLPGRTLVWLAERLATGERFACRIHTDREMDDAFLAHLQLPRAHFANAISHSDFCERWASFLRPLDTLVVYHKGSLTLLRNDDARHTPAIVLKSVCSNLDLRFASIDELPDSPLDKAGPLLPGRAGVRLMKSIALVNQLRTLPGR